MNAAGSLQGLLLGIKAVGIWRMFLARYFEAEELDVVGESLQLDRLLIHDLVSAYRIADHS